LYEEQVEKSNCSDTAGYAFLLMEKGTAILNCLNAQEKIDFISSHIIPFETREEFSNFRSILKSKKDVCLLDDVHWETLNGKTIELVSSPITKGRRLHISGTNLFSNFGNLKARGVYLTVTISRPLWQYIPPPVQIYVNNEPLANFSKSEKDLERMEGKTDLQRAYISTYASGFYRFSFCCFSIYDVEFRFDIPLTVKADAVEHLGQVTFGEDERRSVIDTCYYVHPSIFKLHSFYL